ncbi:hypothetical protein [Namhaeicola litoreus]|uniref:Oxygen tolerance n=1 Tax=Namhaeicola litoreus TaxID=1052145 RepID=A0ABW3Y4A8_9FLAO
MEKRERNINHKDNLGLSRKNFFGALVFIFAFIYVGQAQVKISVDTTKIRIGEQIEYKIFVDKDTLKDVAFPVLNLDSLKKLEVVESFNVDSINNQIFRKYTLTSFDSGRYMLPKQGVLVNNVEVYTDSLFIDVTTVEVDTLKQKLFPIKTIEEEPYVFDDFKEYLWWLLGLLLLTLLIWYLLKRKKKSVVEKKIEIPPFEEAKQRLKELDSKNLVKQNRVKLYYVELTDIVRTFIERELNIPALESTTDELLDIITDFNASSKLGIPNETIFKLKKLLQEADLVKFAKSHPMENEIDLHRRDAENIIEIMHPKVEETERKEGYES